MGGRMKGTKRQRAECVRPANHCGTALKGAMLGQGLGKQQQQDTTLKEPLPGRQRIASKTSTATWQSFSSLIPCL